MYTYIHIENNKNSRSGGSLEHWRLRAIFFLHWRLRAISASAGFGVFLLVCPAFLLVCPAFLLVCPLYVHITTCTLLLQCVLTFYTGCFY